MNFHLFAGAQFKARNGTVVSITKIEVIEAQTEIFFRMNYVDGFNTNEENSLHAKGFLQLLQQFDYQAINKQVMK